MTLVMSVMSALVLLLFTPAIAIRLAPPEVSIGPDGGYTNILIKLEDDLCPHNTRACATDTVSRLQDLLNTSSSVLSSVMSGRAYFHSFSLLLPRSWRGYFHVEEVASVSARDPDIIVMETSDDDHDHDDDQPHVDHSEGCGAQSHRIYLPRTFLDNNPKNTTHSLRHRDNNSAQIFVNKWIDFRFGVFGFRSDSVNDITADEEMTEHMSNETLDGVNVTIDQLILSDQTSLCDGKHYQEVITQHPDIQQGTHMKTDNEPMRAITPEIRLILEPEIKYVLAIETTAVMGERDNWKWVNKAAQKLIRYDMADNSQVAVVSFSNVTRIENGLERVTAESRERMADTIPGKYQLVDHNIRNISHGYITVVCIVTDECRDISELFVVICQEIVGENMGGVHVIIISSAAQHSLSISDQVTVSQLVRTYGLTVSNIMIPTLGQHDPFYDTLSQTSGGHSFLVQASPHPMDTFVSILEYLMVILQTDDARENTFVVHKNEHFTTARNLTTRGSFRLDAWLGQNTQFGVYVPDTEDHLIKSVKFEDGHGRVFGPYTKMSTSFDLINYKTPNIAGPLPSFLTNTEARIQSGGWKYQIEWFEHTGDPVKSVIVVSSGVSDVAGVTVTCWMSRKQWSQVSQFQYITLFARVRLGSVPVLNASVSVGVEIETNNGTFLGMSPRQMRDDGNGDDDMISGDGIYSLTITDYPSQGRYKFTISTDDNDKKAHVIDKFGKQSKMFRPSGLRSLEDPDVHGPTFISRFSRTVYGPVVHLSNVPQEDVIPPSKIGDLLITPSDNKETVINPHSNFNTLHACWTSGGGDLSTGSVDKFVFVFSDVASDLISGDQDINVLTLFERSSVHGERLCHDLSIPVYNVPLYYAVYGEDTAGNRGQVSNIVKVQVTWSRQKTGLELDNMDNQLVRSSNSEDTGPDWLLISIMSACLGGLFVICISVITFLYVSARRNRPSSPTPSSSTHVKEDHTDSSSCDSDRTEHCYSRHVSSSSHVSGKQVTDLHQILSPDDPADEGHHSQRIVPVYWSASQLLSKLDQRQQGQSQNLPSHRNYQNQSSYQQNHLNYPHNMNDNYQYDDSRYSDQVQQHLNYTGESPTSSSYPPETSPSLAGTVDQELGHVAVMTRDNTRDVTRDSETDFTLDSEQSTTETDFQTFPLNHSHTPRPESVSPEPTGFRFERNGFYKSTRFRGGAGSVDDDDEEMSYHDMCTMSPETVGNIPEKYFVTVSGFDDSPPRPAGTPHPHVTNVTMKPRNVTEV